VINQPAHDPCVWNHVRNERPILFWEYKKRKDEEEICTFILLFIVREIEDIDEKKNKEPVDI
jgi:hypothetical protein